MKRTIVLIITLLAMLLFGATLARAVLYVPDSEVAAPEQEANAPIQEVTEEDQPARLIIPSLGVDTHVQYVGITAAGNMAVPSNFTDVGWYRYGTVPGQRGSAVVAGHVDNAIGLAGVFKRLEELDVGAEVFVETKGGERLRFLVTDAETYGYRDVPVERVFNQGDARRLNLVTCGGSWIQSERSYDERLVVYTVLAP